MIGLRTSGSRTARGRRSELASLLSAALALAALPESTQAQPRPVPSPAARPACPSGLNGTAGLRLRPNRVRAEPYLVVFGEASGRSDSDALARVSTFSRPDLERLSATLQEQLGKKVILSYRATLIGFLAVLGPEDVRRICDLAAAADVPVIVTPDRKMVLPEPDRSRQRLREAARAKPLIRLQMKPPLGLDRTDQRLLKLDRRFRTLQSARDVHVYVIDTGIFGEHNDFAGPGGSRVSYDVVPGLGESAQTGACLGHGTAVASVIAGLRHGIAVESQLHSLRVFNECSQETSAGRVMAAVDWVASQRELYPTRPMLVNISLASLDVVEPDPNEPNSHDLLDAAIERSILESKITHVVAAGNNHGADACAISPARVKPAITVSGIIPTSDGRPGFANQGSCVDLFAPGTDIRMAWVGHPAKERTDQGTSFAAPHVAGVAALVLQNEFEADPSVAADPFQLWKKIDAAATTRTEIPSWCGIANISPQTPEKLLHWGSGSSDGTVDEHPNLVGTQSC